MYLDLILYRCIVDSSIKVKCTSYCLFNEINDSWTKYLNYPINIVYEIFIL